MTATTESPQAVVPAPALPPLHQAVPVPPPEPPALDSLLPADVASDDAAPPAVTASQPQSAPQAQPEFVELEALEKGLASEVLGSPVSPDDVPDMSVWGTICWVAREGGSKDFDVSDSAAWDPAIVTVISKLSSEIPFTGQLSENDPQDVVPNYKLRGIVDSGALVKDRVVHPYQGASFHAEMVFNNRLILDLGGPDGDRLFPSAGGQMWLNLRVSSADVKRLWPFGRKGRTGPFPALSNNVKEKLQKLVAGGVLQIEKLKKSGSEGGYSAESLAEELGCGRTVAQKIRMEVVAEINLLPPNPGK